MNKNCVSHSEEYSLEDVINVINLEENECNNLRECVLDSLSNGTLRLYTEHVFHKSLTAHSGHKIHVWGLYSIHPL